MTIHPNGFQYVQVYEHDDTTIQLGLYGIDQPIPIRVHPSLRYIMHRSIQTFVGTHRERLYTYNNDDVRNPKVHHFHKRMLDGPMELSEPGAKLTSAVIRMFALYRTQGNAIVTIKCTSGPDDTDNSSLSIYEPNRHTTFPLHDITLNTFRVRKSKVSRFGNPSKSSFRSPRKVAQQLDITHCHSNSYPLTQSRVSVSASPRPP